MPIDWSGFGAGRVVEPAAPTNFRYRDRVVPSCFRTPGPTPERGDRASPLVGAVVSGVPAFRLGSDISGPDMSAPGGSEPGGSGSEMGGGGGWVF